MDGTNILKETPHVTAPVASNTLSVNVVAAPGKAMVGKRPKPFGEALAVLEQSTLANCQQRLSSPNEHSSTIFVPSASF